MLPKRTQQLAVLQAKLGVMAPAPAPAAPATLSVQPQILSTTPDCGTVVPIVSAATIAQVCLEANIPPELGRLMARWAADPALQMSFFSQFEPMSNTMIQQIREEEKEEDEEEEEEEHPHQPSARDGTVSAHRGTARAVIATSGSSAVSSALATHLQAFDRYKVPLHSYEEYLSEQDIECYLQVDSDDYVQTSSAPQQPPRPAAHGYPSSGVPVQEAGYAQPPRPAARGYPSPSSGAPVQEAGDAGRPGVVPGGVHGSEEAATSGGEGIGLQQKSRTLAVGLIVVVGVLALAMIAQTASRKVFRAALSTQVARAICQLASSIDPASLMAALRKK